MTNYEYLPKSHVILWLAKGRVETYKSLNYNQYMNKLLLVTSALNLILILKLSGFFSFAITLAASAGIYYILDKHFQLKKRIPDLAGVVVPHVAGIVVVNKFFGDPLLTLAAILLETLAVVIFFSMSPR
ncbi:hypothetical protein HYW61_00870 [candidate division WWE3 bacterium]|nr:hypothetical protein [candidate division WWE3 bacterium]